MRFHTQRKHMIDFLFSVALFFVFALSALIVILLAARIYQSTTEHSSLNYTSRTSLSYISEKIHQNESDGAVYLGNFDGYEALVMEQKLEDVTYYTYIYACNNELKELFTSDTSGIKASSGQTILEIKDFSMEEISDNLFKFSCTDENNQQASTMIGVRSR